MLPRELITRWRERAQLLREHGAREAALTCRKLASELEAAIREYELDALDTDVAAAESGYTEFHIRRLIQEGKIPNAGTEARPMVLRRNLPRKPGYGIIASTRPGPLRSIRQVGRAIANGEY
jgi:hypothetical protein